MFECRSFGWPTTHLGQNMCYLERGHTDCTEPANCLVMLRFEGTIMEQVIYFQWHEFYQISFFCSFRFGSLSSFFGLHKKFVLSSSASEEVKKRTNRHMSAIRDIMCFVPAIRVACNFIHEASIQLHLICYHVLFC